VHGGEQRNGRDSGSTDLDDDRRHVQQHSVCDVADQADRGRADQQTPEEPDGRRWFLCVISVWVEGLISGVAP
jgi:hypothetical protein